MLGAVHSDNEEVGAGMPYFIYPGFIAFRIVAQVSVTQPPYNPGIQSSGPLSNSQALVTVGLQKELGI